MRYPYIIGEAGSCHEGVIDRAMSLVYTAKHTGCDAVKFQYWSSPARMRERRHVEDPQAYEKGSVRWEWLEVLRRAAKGLKMDFMCTAYLPEDIPIVAPYVDMFKVSSFEQARDFTVAHGGYGKPVVVSMGMQGHAWQADAPVYYLHCVSGYPTPVDQAALQGIALYGDGYSDHTRHVLTGAVAVGAGAKILEVHFRLDDTKPECPDYVVALSPVELMQYVQYARVAARMMSSTKSVQDCERENMKHRVGV